MAATSPPLERSLPRFAALAEAGRREPLLSTPVGLVATSRPPAPGRGRAPWWPASILLHALTLLALVYDPPRRTPNELPAPAFDVVFEGGQPERPAAEPAPGLNVPPAPPPAASAPPAPPPPPVPVPVPPSPPAPAPPAIAAPIVPPPPTPSPPVAALPRPPVVVPPPVPPAEEPSSVRVPELAEMLPRPPELRLRERVEAPPEAAPRPAPPQPAAPPRQAAPALPPGVIWMPNGVQLGRPADPAAPAGRPNARGLDTSVDPRMVEGRATADPSMRVSGAQVGADWRAAFRRWLDQNMRYPQRAIELGESGVVRVEIRAAPDGTVLGVRLVRPSASPSLNLGTTFPFSGARLPPFPPPADPNGVTIDLTVNYFLIR